MLALMEFVKFITGIHDYFQVHIDQPFRVQCLKMVKHSQKSCNVYTIFKHCA